MTIETFEPSDYDLRLAEQLLAVADDIEAGRLNPGTGLYFKSDVLKRMPCCSLGHACDRIGEKFGPEEASNGAWKGLCQIITVNDGRSPEQGFGFDNTDLVATIRGAANEILAGVVPQWKPQLSVKQAAEKAIADVIAQGKQAVGAAGACLYCTDDGTRCAVGIELDVHDDEAKRLRGSAYNIYPVDAPNRAGVESNQWLEGHLRYEPIGDIKGHVSMLSALQQSHDNAFKSCYGHVGGETFAEGFKRLCRKNETLKQFNVVVPS